ncbi:MAG: efflux RND transporter periplasmic adaptor subunit [Dokdonella sp.]|nr:efflux RND transporter periplasmic adaptor subunit [Dokdonella sp.]
MARTEARAPSTARRMTLMVICIGALLSLLIGWNVLGQIMMKKAAQNMPVVPQTVTSTKVGYDDWQPQLGAVGSLRASRGADLAFDASGVISAINFKSGDQVRQGDVLVQLRDEDDAALLNQADTAAALAKVTLDRAQRQINVKAISQADFDTATADYKAKQASVQYARAVLAKKQLRAPFAGRVGIITLSPGAYVSAGSAVVTLQQLDPVLVDFNVPQRNLAELKLGQRVTLRSDAHPDSEFEATLSAIDPKVDTATRNVRVEASAANGDGLLVPGMFVKTAVDVGASARQLTLPQTAITFNPYGETVFLVKAASGKAASGKADKPTAQQAFVKTGATRGDQIAILSGVVEGDEVVSSGQLKLKNGTPLVIDNSHPPSDQANPTPQEH